MNALYRSYLVTVPSTELALPLPEAVEHLRLGDNSEDNNYVIALIRAVARHVEGYLGRSLLTQTIRDTHDGFPPCSEPFLLRVGPVQSVTSITYRASDGTLATVDAANYVTDLSATPARIGLAVSGSWPTPQARLANVLVTYVAGYGALPSDIPDDIRAAMKLILYDLYENRHNRVQNLPTAAEALLAPYRIQQLA